MKTYTGTKVIRATPMTRIEYNALRGWPLPADENGSDAGFLVEYTDGGRQNMPGFAGYVSWSPSDVFERSYKPSDTWLDRLRIERDELAEKLQKLYAYIETPAFGALGEEDAMLLLDQRNAMAGYLEILTVRIERGEQ